jgi:pyruvate/2-oxoglutarate dehydrogenase complex dihydrolipoamide acyltransferase (E2) component
MPRVADSVDTVSVLEWEKSPGDEVTEGDVLFRVETDKAEVEVPSPVSGRLAERLVEGGDDATTGDAVAVVETA